MKKTIMTLSTVCLLALLAVSITMAQEKEVESFKATEITSGAIYRGNLRRSGVFDKTGITAGAKEKWKAEIGGKLFSSPVVWEGKLFIGAADGVYCLDTKDGSQKWKFDVKEGVESSACVANGKVLFASKKGNLLCLNAETGEKLWVYKGKARTPNVKSSPAVAYGVAFCGLGSEIAAVNLETGKKIWTIKKNAPLEFSSVALTKDTVFVAAGPNWSYLFSYNLETTETNWRSNGPYEGGAGVYLAKSLSLDEEDGVYINSTRGVRKYSWKHKGNAAKGQHMRVWYKFLLDKQVDDNELMMHTCPTPWKDKVFVGRKDGKFVALATKAKGREPKEFWRKQMPAECLSDPSVAAKSSVVIFGCNDGNVYGLDCATGDQKWAFKTGAEIFASPWVEDGVVYVASHDGFVYALEEK